jgi:hypothetical protein
VLCIVSYEQFWNVHMECLKVCISPHCNLLTTCQTAKTQSVALTKESIREKDAD